MTMLISLLLGEYPRKYVGNIRIIMRKISLRNVQYTHVHIVQIVKYSKQNQVVYGTRFRMVMGKIQIHKDRQYVDKV